MKNNKKMENTEPEGKKACTEERNQEVKEGNKAKMLTPTESKQRNKRKRKKVRKRSRKSTRHTHIKGEKGL